MTTREDFEKWFADSYGIDISIDRAGEGYIYDQINDKWIGYQACAAHYEAELLKRDALIAEKDKALQAVKDLISESYGVAGLHKNGYVAAWDELQTGGRFEEWLSPFDEALSLTHDSVRLVEVGEIEFIKTRRAPQINWCANTPITNGHKLYTIVKGEAG